MITQHKAGPWKFEGGARMIEPSGAIGKKKWFAVEGKKPGTSLTIDIAFVRTEQDARLIAAAPELLAAAAKALDWINRFGEHAPIQFGGEATLADELRLTIAKATGQAVTP